MIKIAIIDDEKEIRDFFVSLIQKQDIDAQVMAFPSAELLLQEGQMFDLLFLDIEMQGMSGMELAEHIRKGTASQPVIVFVTGYEDYVFDAFDVDAFHYLLKPVNEEKLSQVLHRAVQKIQKKRQPVIEVRFGGISRNIAASDIYYIESFNHKICVHTAEHSMEYYARIGELEEVLKDTFFRIHKGYLINLAYIDSYTRTEVVLTNGVRLFISKYKYHAFIKAYLQYLKTDN